MSAADAEKNDGPAVCSCCGEPVSYFDLNGDECAFEDFKRIKQLTETSSAHKKQAEVGWDDVGGKAVVATSWDGTSPWRTGVVDVSGPRPRLVADLVERYASRSEAVEGHARMVNLLRQLAEMS